MTTRQKNISVFCFILLIAVGIYVWSYPLNKGKLSVSANVAGYQIVSDDGVLECPQNPCVINLKTGVPNIEIQKSGYISNTLNIQILRGRTTDATVELVKIPSLNESQVIPENQIKPMKNIPGALDGLPIISPVWNADETSLAYVDKNDEKLKIWKGEGDIKTVTPLKNITKDFQLSWSPDSLYLLGKEGNDLYFINILQASRKKSVIAFEPEDIIWLQKSDSALFNDDSNDLYLADFTDQTIKPLSINLDLANSVWDINGNLISFSYNKDNFETTFESFDPEIKEKKIIFTKYKFAVSKIVADDNKKIYSYSSDDGKWYNLDY